MDEGFEDQPESPKNDQARQILDICSERERIEIQHENVLQAFTFGKPLMYGGQPDRDEIIKLQSRYPNYIKNVPQKSEAEIQAEKLSRKTTRFSKSCTNSNLAGSLKLTRRHTSSKF